MKANNILKLLPCLAAFLTIPANAGDDEKVTLNKTATYNYETQTGEITLETYLQGGVRTTASTSSTKPLDVLMVLDYSGSMTDSYSDSKSKTYNTYSVDKHTYNEWNKNQSGYSVKVGTENCTVKCVKNSNPDDTGNELCWAYVETNDETRYYLTLDGTLYKSNDKSPSATSYPKSVDGVTIFPICGTACYLFGIQSANNGVTVNSRITGLKAAVGTFIDLLYENAKSTGATHRVSLLTFQNPKYPKANGKDASRTNYVNDTEPNYYLRPFWVMTNVDGSGGTNNKDWWQNCTGVMTQFRSIVEGNTKESMKAAMEVATVGGCTAIDYAMYVASKQIKNARSDAERIIIVFTDGKPTHAKGFILNACVISGYNTSNQYMEDEDVANGAIKFSKECKKTAKVYTIGLFGSKDKPKAGFMEALSSNYPDATSMTATGTAGAEQTFSIEVSGNLTETFENIANASIGKATFTTETIIQDAMNMNYFKLPAGMTKNDVKLYMDTCIGYNATTKVYSFANDLKPISIPADSINVDVNTGIVKIKGFDFQANWCGLVNTTPHGNRLVAKFPFELKGGDNMPTNVLTNDGTKSGLIPKPESGAYPSAPTDAALKFPTPSLKFATIEIVRKGLDEGESAIYIVTTLDTVKHVTDTVACVSVNGVGADQPVSKFIYGLEAGAGKMYKVTETNWNWAYKKDPTSGYIEKEVNPSDNSAVQFVFGGTHIEKSSTDPTEKLHPAEIHNHDEQYIPNVINVESLK